MGCPLLLRLLPPPSALRFAFRVLVVRRLGPGVARSRFAAGTVTLCGRCARGLRGQRRCPLLLRCTSFRCARLRCVGHPVICPVSVEAAA